MATATDAATEQGLIERARAQARGRPQLYRIFGKIAPRRILPGPKAWLVLADSTAMVLALAVAYWVRAAVGAPLPAGTDNDYLVVSCLSLPTWPVFFARRKLYIARFVTRNAEEFRRILGAVAVGTVTTMAVAYALEMSVARGWLMLTYVFGVVAVTLERAAARRVFTGLRLRGRLLRSVIVVGTNAEGVELARMLTTDRSLGYRVVGFVDCDPNSPLNVMGIPVLGSVEQTAVAVHATGASGVVMAATAMDLGSSNRLIRDLTEQGVHVELSSTLRDIASNRLTVRPLGRFPVVYVEPVPRTGWRTVAKRAFDVTFAAVGLLVSLPFLALAAIAIKVDSPGPILFRQERVGRNGRRFMVLKLRTMVRNAEDLKGTLIHLNEAGGPLFKIRSDPRVTRVGRLLRKLSLDELPQLWNVIRGEMSLVGPRPALPAEVEAWPADLHGRLRVRPGITGMWQVEGRSNTSFEDYERLDLYYVDNWSLVSDLTILAKTLPVVLSRKGAY